MSAPPAWPTRLSALPEQSLADVQFRIHPAPRLGIEAEAFATPQAISNDAAVVGGRTWGDYGDTGSVTNPFGSQASEAWADGYTGSPRVAVGVIDSGVDYRHIELYQNIWLNQREIPSALRAALKDVDGDARITFRDLNAAGNSGWVTDKNGNHRIDAGDLLNDIRWENGVDEDGNGYKDDLIGWDFKNNDNDPLDELGHGTHAAGTIAAQGGNGVGVAGVTWSTQIVVLQFMDRAGGLVSGAVKAVDYFTNASKSDPDLDYAATNNSWGGSGYSSAMLASITRAAEQDILFISSAMNGGSDKIGDNNDAMPIWPANYNTAAVAGYDAVISVTSIDNSGKLSAFANYGAKTVDIGAPGQMIYSTMAGGGYAYMSGTSMAAPFVTGAVALYSAANPGASAAEIRAAILNSGSPTASLAGRTVTGDRLDIDALMSGGATATAPVSSASSITGTAGSDLISATATISGQRLASSLGDTIAGLAGADTLDGGAGADRLIGGTGNDRYIVDNASDVLVELAGQGSDHVDASISFMLAANLENLTLTGSGATTAVGNALNNVLKGNGAANKLLGSAGNDQLSGGGGNDSLSGGDGSDVLRGEAGGDTLNGGTGDDALRGGVGADNLSGGAGTDRFQFGRGEVAGDVIRDFAPGDQIELSGYGPGSTLTRVAASTTDWIVTDKATGFTEVFELANSYKLSSNDFLFT